MSERPGGGGIRPSVATAVCDATNTVCVSGSYERARPVRRRRLRAHRQRRDRTFRSADGRRREDRSEPVARHELHRLRAKLRREVDQVVDRQSLPVVRRRLGRERLRRRVPLARRVALRNRALFDRPDRLAGLAIEDIQKRLLGRLRERLDRPAVDGDVGQDRRRRNVHVPDAVVHQLVVPLPLPGSQIDRDDALAEQVVARDGRRRSSRASAARSAGTRVRALRRPTSAPIRRCCRV